MRRGMTKEEIQQSKLQIKRSEEAALAAKEAEKKKKAEEDKKLKKAIEM